MLDLDRNKNLKILILSLAGVGDTLLFTPALRLIRKNYPHTKITAVVMYQSSADLFKYSRDLDEVIFFPFFKKGYLKSLLFLKKLRERKFDLCINTYPSNRWEYNIVCFLTGARFRISHQYMVGGDYKTGLLLHTATMPQFRYLHNVEENIRLLELLNIRDDLRGHKLTLPLSVENHKKADEILLQHHIRDNNLMVGFHAGTSQVKNLHLRRWPEEKFAILSDNLAKFYGATSIFFGSKEEKNTNQKIFSLSKISPIVIDNLEILDVAALIKRCRIFISNDSALMHIASAMRVPTIAIFGPTDPRIVYPYGTRHKIVSKNSSCSPCYFYSKMPLHCPKNKNFACIQSIEPAEVMSAFKSLLDTPKRREYETTSYRYCPNQKFRKDSRAMSGVY